MYCVRDNTTSTATTHRVGCVRAHIYYPRPPFRRCTRSSPSLSTNPHPASPLTQPLALPSPSPLPGYRRCRYLTVDREGRPPYSQHAEQVLRSASASSQTVGTSLGEHSDHLRAWSVAARCRPRRRHLVRHLGRRECLRGPRTQHGGAALLRAQPLVEQHQLLLGRCTARCSAGVASGVAASRCTSGR